MHSKNKIEGCMKYKKLGLIAGKGTLPKLIVSEIQKQGGQVFVVKLKDISDIEDYSTCVNETVYIGHAKKAFDFFKENGVKDIVFAGGMKKPSFASLTNLDSLSRELVGRMLKSKFLGDDKVLRTVVKFFEENGFSIVDVSDIIKYNMSSKGFLGSVNFPLKEYKDDIDLGKSILNRISSFDVGQSIVVQNGIVLGIEGLEGTDALLDRCGQLRYDQDSRNPVLIKIKKKTQTRKADLPTIGVQTIENLHKNNFSGLAIQAKSVIILDKEEVIKLADKYNIFIYGF